MPSALGI